MIDTINLRMELHKMSAEMLANEFGIDVLLRLPDYVVFNGPATIVFWANGCKTIAKCSKDDTFDKKMGFLMAYFRKHSGLSKTQTAKFLKRMCEDDNS